MKALLFVVGMALLNPSSAETVHEKCMRRISARSSLTHSETEKFCTCFIGKGSAKYGVQRIRSEMESGGSEEFKSTLRAEFSTCKKQARIGS